MNTHHTKTKGDLGVAKVNCRLVELGYLTLNPNTEHAPFDLVAYKDGLFSRVQVKYKAARGRKVLVDLRSCYSTSTGTVTKNLDKTEVDLVAIYCPDTDKCYFIDPSEMGQAKTLNLDLDLTEYLDIKLKSTTMFSE